jgi:hypothetical protein
VTGRSLWVADAGRTQRRGKWPPNLWVASGSPCRRTGWPFTRSDTNAGRYTSTNSTSRPTSSGASRSVVSSRYLSTRLGSSRPRCVAAESGVARRPAPRASSWRPAVPLRPHSPRRAGRRAAPPRRKAQRARRADGPDRHTMRNTKANSEKRGAHCRGAMRGVSRFSVDPRVLVSRKTSAPAREQRPDNLGPQSRARTGCRTWPARIVPSRLTPLRTAPAAPMPPPMHMVTTTYFTPRRLPSISAWPPAACPTRRTGGRPRWRRR